MPATPETEAALDKCINVGEPTEEATSWLTPFNGQRQRRSIGLVSLPDGLHVFCDIYLKMELNFRMQ